MNYSQYEVKRAQDQLAPMLKRKLNSSSLECETHLLNDLKCDLLVEKVEWLLTGTYGSEYRDLLISDYVTSPMKKQAIKRICINAFIYTCLIDYENLNARKITNIMKETGKMDAINAHLIEFMTSGYGAQHWGLIDS